MRSKQIKKNIILFLAIFIRYGYFLLMAIILYIIGVYNVSKNTEKFAFGGLIILYGLYLITGYLLKFKHIYCALQNAYHKKMTPPGNDFYFTTEMKRDIIFISCFFVIGGIALIIIGCLGI